MAPSVRLSVLLGLLGGCLILFALGVQEHSGSIEGLQLGDAGNRDLVSEVPEVPGAYGGRKPAAPILGRRAISGIVQDAFTSAVLQGASIRIIGFDGSEVATTTDAEGIFHVLVDGGHTKGLECTAVGYVCVFVPLSRLITIGGAPPVIKMPPLTSLAVMVAATDGSPIAGATVRQTIEPQAGRRNTTSVPAAESVRVTDERGVAMFSSCPIGLLVTVVARHPSYMENMTTFDCSASGGPGPVVLVLAQAGALRGRVVDMYGDGIGGAAVVLKAARSLASSHRFQAVTDASGWYSFLGVQTGWAVVALFADPTVQQEVEIASGQETIAEDLTSALSVLLTGRILNQCDTGGAYRVKAHSDGAYATEVTADALGLFSVLLPEGSVDLMVFDACADLDPTRSAALARWTGVPPSEGTVLDILIEEGGLASLSARVLSVNEGSQVSVCLVARSETKRLVFEATGFDHRWMSSEVGSDGAVYFDCVAPGRYDVLFVAGAATAWRTNCLLVGGSCFAVGELQLGLGAVAGLVRGADSRAQTGAVELTNLVFTNGLAERCYAANIDSAGAFHLEDVLPGAYLLRVKCDDSKWPPEHFVDVHAGRESNVGALELGACSVRGVVRGDGGYSLVRIKPEQGGIAEWVQSDALGHFAFEHLSPGAYTVMCQDGVALRLVLHDTETKYITLDSGEDFLRYRLRGVDGEYVHIQRAGVLALSGGQRSEGGRFAKVEIGLDNILSVPRVAPTMLLIAVVSGGRSLMMAKLSDTPGNAVSEAAVEDGRLEVELPQGWNGAKVAVDLIEVDGVALEGTFESAIQLPAVEVKDRLVKVRYLPIPCRVRVKSMTEDLRPIECVLDCPNQSGTVVWPR